MDLTDQQLAVVLQACLEFTRELLEKEGGFLPFGARAKPDGTIEFLQIFPEGEGDSLEDIYRRIGSQLAEDAGRSEIVASALVANVSLPGHDQCHEGHFHTAAAVLIESPKFCRSIVAPYRVARASNGKSVAVEFANMVPEEGERIVFAG